MKNIREPTQQFLHNTFTLVSNGKTVMEDASARHCKKVFQRSPLSVLMINLIARRWRARAYNNLKLKHQNGGTFLWIPIICTAHNSQMKLFRFFMLILTKVIGGGDFQLSGGVLGSQSLDPGFDSCFCLGQKGLGSLDDISVILLLFTVFASCLLGTSQSHMNSQSCIW